MRDFQTLTSLNMVESFIDKHPLAFLYISRPNCSVCHGLLPQVQELMMRYPDIHLAHIDVTEVPELAGKFSIFTVPVLLLFVDGKEYIREARIVHMQLLEDKIDKIYENRLE
ncbi:thiol-disulfide isomerase/thioredoxin [Virgibacillus halotolerans]|uniref:thioredoxin family protein n=1 Tax=Virgibacillus halotolerans TaxID=1071053 RepID=UPI001961DC46|nr:thioredoxin family protein [Virgibacillus halotolerans]MBM7599714.1 thiol-disulfide isomerase/thioredoxin [Virgibacillus halotolerans]